jgi:hypothetical protein
LLTEIQPSKSYMKQLTRLFIVVPQAAEKNASRLKQFENIRNSLSLTAALHSHTRRNLSLDMWCSFDDVSVYLEHGKKPRVLTTKKAQKLLGLMNLSVSTESQKTQRRMITFNCMIAPDGSLLSRVAKISDHSFLDRKTVPGLFHFGEGRMKLNVILVHPKLPDPVLYTALYKRILIPAAVEHRAQMEGAASLGLREIQVSSQSTTASQCARNAVDDRAIPAFDDVCPELDPYSDDDDDDDEVGAEQAKAEQKEAEQPRNEQLREEFHPSYYQLKNPQLPAEVVEAAAYYAQVVVTSDGAQGQIDAVMVQINGWIKTNTFPVELIKYAGGCSMTQSANDVGAMHRILHACFKVPSYRYEDTADLAGGDVVKFKAVLKKYKMTPGSFNTYWKCLMHTPDFLEKASQPMYIKSAFKTAGVAPYNAKKILSVNPYFRKLNTDDAQFVVDRIPELAEVYDEKDVIHEQDYERILHKPGVGPMDNVGTKIKGKPLNQMAVPRQRVAKISGDTFQETFMPIIEDNKNKRDAGKKRKADASKASSSSSSAAAAPSATVTPSATVAPSVVKKRKRVTYTDPPSATAAATTTTTTAVTTTDATTAGAIASATADATTVDAVPPVKKKRKVTRRCSNTGCTTKLDAALVADEWTAYGNGKCKLYFCCTSNQCQQSLAQHIFVCGT